MARASHVALIRRRICYAYSGAMVGQMVHLGVVQGYSFVPWALLLMVALSRRLAELEGDPAGGASRGSVCRGSWARRSCGD